MKGSSWTAGHRPLSPELELVRLDTKYIASGISTRALCCSARDVARVYLLSVHCLMHARVASLEGSPLSIKASCL